MPTPVLLNRVYVNSATVGTGDASLGASKSSAFLTFAEAGAVVGNVVCYVIEEGNNFELGYGTYGAGPVLSRDTVLVSKIGGAVGNTKMALGGAATVRLITSAIDMNDAGLIKTGTIDPARLPASLVTIADTPPGTPIHGSMWWDSSEGVLYIYFNDGTSAQWVVAAPWQAGLSQAQADTLYLKLTGGTLNVAPNNGLKVASTDDLFQGVVYYSGSGSLAVGTITNHPVHFYMNNSVRMSLDASGLLPSVSATYNLGSAALRWNTVYTSDLSLSNGIGDWTIVEGEDDLFLYNNKRGKTYKFWLVEVPPEDVPPKKT